MNATFEQTTFSGSRHGEATYGDAMDAQAEATETPCPAPFSFKSTVGMFDTPLTHGCPCPDCGERLVVDTDNANYLVCTNPDRLACFFEARVN